jgi:hypothetical protein
VQLRDQRRNFRPGTRPAPERGLRERDHVRQGTVLVRGTRRSHLHRDVHRRRERVPAAGRPSPPEPIDAIAYQRDCHDELSNRSFRSFHKAAKRSIPIYNM